MFLVSCYQNEKLSFYTKFRRFEEAKKFFFECYDSGMYDHISLEVIDED